LLTVSILDVDIPYNAACGEKCHSPEKGPENSPEIVQKISIDLERRAGGRSIFPRPARGRIAKIFSQA
jgi:hypothetical protein